MSDNFFEDFEAEAAPEAVIVNLTPEQAVEVKAAFDAALADPDHMVITNYEVSEPVDVGTIPPRADLPVEVKRAPIPPDMVEYLITLISPPDERAQFLGELESVDFEKIKATPDLTVCGIIVRGTPSDVQSKEFLRILKPGAHFILIAPDDVQPTGHTGACNIEDAGFEIRDAILWVREPGDFHYVPKASRSEREAGCELLPVKAGTLSEDDKNEMSALVAKGDTLTEEETARLEELKAAEIAAAAENGIRNFHPCLHPEALVLTASGYRPIREIPVGARVFAADGKFHTVEAVSSHPYTHPHLFEIAVRGTNYTTLASNNHPFLIWRSTRKDKHITGGEVLWAQAEDLKVGDYTMTPISQCGTLPDDKPEGFWFLLGLFIAEGVIQKAGHGVSTYPSFTLHEDETDLIGAIKKYFEPRVNVGVYPKPGAKAVQVVAFDPNAATEFKRLGGCGASTKVLAPEVFEYPASVRKQILDGWLAGDGGKVRTYLQAKTVSPDLAGQMAILAEEAGYHVNLFRVEAQPGKIGDRGFKKTLPSYTLQLYSLNGNQTDRKPSRPMTVTHDGVTYTLRRIKAITHVPYTGDVWNLTVEGSHTFQTAVGMSHNTVKPKDLMERLLGNVPKDKGPVVDPFHGSGTTGLACIETGHDFIGIDREKDYVTIATARAVHAHNQMTGDRYSNLKIETDAVLPKAEEKAPVEFGDW